MLVIWTGPQDELVQFISFIAHNNFNLKFTMQFDTQFVSFLDVNLDADGSLYTTLHRKEMAGNTILLSTSAHPRPLVWSIPYSQYLRLQRNCAREEDFEIEAKAL